MKKLALLTVLMIFIYATAFSQKNTPITMRNGFFGWQFRQGETKLKMGEVFSLLESNTEAYNSLKSAQSNNTLAGIIGSIGGFLLGYPLGTAAGGGDPNWTLAAVGGGLVVVSIPISINANKKPGRRWNFTTKAQNLHLTVELISDWASPAMALA